MATEKKPVGRTPIGDPSYLRRIDPVWVHGPVRCRFWEDRAHRRDYLLWLGHKLRFHYMTDWYRLAGEDLTQNHGHGVMNRYWRSSPIAALKDCFPEYDWKEWFFQQVPLRFWESRGNCRRYLNWLADRLGYRRWEDWYKVRVKDFLRNRGISLLAEYKTSPARALMDVFPGRNWCEWKFSQVTDGFWRQARNRHRYLHWLGRQLGFQRPADWYQIRHDDIASHHGSGLFTVYPSLYDVMREFLPKLDWDQMDKHLRVTVPQVLAWSDAYHAQHDRWPTRRSGEIPGSRYTWSVINSSLYYGHHGLPKGLTLARFLKEHRGVQLPQPPAPLSEEQIATWADAFFASNGKLPTGNSGRIPGTRETWSSVIHALARGNRGLRTRSTLGQLLARQRGVRNRKFPPMLLEQQILTWARKHHALTGRWPTTKSGPIAAAPGETWSAVETALYRGRRGLPSGLSLARLLKKHALK